MAVIHRIRLRGWPSTPTDHGTTVFSRSFGAPRTVDPEETIWLVCESSPANGSVLLNSKLIGVMVEGGPFATEITTVLQPRNLVTFEVHGAEVCVLEEMVLEFRKG